MKCNFIFLTLASIIFPAPAWLWACPTCSSILERGQDALKASKFAEGIFWSIGCLLGTITLMGILLGLKIYQFLREQNHNSAQYKRT